MKIRSLEIANMLGVAIDLAALARIDLVKATRDSIRVYAGRSPSCPDKNGEL